MSFSSETKNELCNITPQYCCRKAECYGLLLFGRYFTKTSVSLITENREVARRAAQFSAEVTGAMMDVTASVVHRREYSNDFIVSAASEAEASLILNAFGHSGDEISLRANLGNLENDCCRSAFLRGAFLSCGTITNPQKDYHLEFVVPYMNLAKDLVSFLRNNEEMELEPGMVNRKGMFVVYVKGGDRVADLLTFLGAGKAAMDLMQVKMLKEVRNNVNRKTNFETANIDKTASAAAAQLMALKKINAKEGISALPEELRELAFLRFRNPEMSLRELGENLSEPLSRSGVHHRLQRIVDLANEMGGEKSS
jgi:cell division protein WhiA